MFKFLLILLCFTTIVWCKLPNGVEQCPVGDKTCIINNINYVFQKKFKGDEEFGLPKLKLMDAGDAVIDKGVRTELKNMKIDGLKNVKATNVKGFGPNPDGDHEIIFEAPILSLLSDYKSEGKVLVFSLSGQGKANYTMVEPVIKLKITGKSLIKDDKLYLDVISTEFVLLKKKQFIVYHYDLFKDNENLNEQFHEVLNQATEVLEEFVVPIFDALQKIVFVTVKNVFSKTPYNELFKISE